MIISMRPHATREEIDHVCERIREFGYKVHSIEGEERVVIGVVGIGDVTDCLESLEATPGVERAVRISAPYKFVSKEFKKERTQMRVNGLEIGGDEFIVMAGPCSVESERQIMETAEGVRRPPLQLQLQQFVLADHGQSRQRCAAGHVGGLHALQDPRKCGTRALRMRNLRRQRRQQVRFAQRRLARLERVVMRAHDDPFMRASACAACSS